MQENEEYFKAHGIYDGNDMFHIALDEKGNLQPIVAVRLKFEEIDLLKKLLNTDKLKCIRIENCDGRLFLIIVDGNISRPYPSAMIWRANKDNQIIDVLQEDLDVVDFVAEKFLR